MASPTVRARQPQLRPPHGTYQGRRRRPWRIALGAVVVLVIVLAAAAAAAFRLSSASLKPDAVALGKLTTGPLAGRLESVRARFAGGRPLPVSVVHGTVTPKAGLVAPGQRVEVDVVVRRPGALSWLLGKRRHERLVVTAPAAHVADTHLDVPHGAHVRVRFDRPVRVLAIGDGAQAVILHRAHGSARIPTQAAVGRTAVAVAPRAWERAGSPQEVTWFPKTAKPAALASPADGAKITPTTALRLTFSRPVAQVLEGSHLKAPAGTSGHWTRPDAYTLAFKATGAGAPLGADLELALPHPVALMDTAGHGHTTSTVSWKVMPGSTLRLQQLLAQAGYLPLHWSASGTPVARTMRAETEAAVTPPRGSFTWRWGNVPGELRGMWDPGHANAITRGALVAFQSAHGLAADGFAGPQTWGALLKDAVAHKRTSGGYSYVYVHRDASPQSLVLWHNGRTILTTPANTGVAAAPTALGTFPVFEHLRVTTMKGTNPDGSHYNDPGIQYVSYFNGGDAIHAFDRASFGTPQSVGCVELPLAAAARVWPYTPIGTLVTIEH